MKGRIRHIGTALALVLAYYLSGQASSLSTSGALFLQEAGARPLGMGAAFVSLADDSSGISFNPAGLDYILQPELMLSYRKNLMDSYYGNVDFVLPAGRGGTWGFSLMVFDTGNIDINYLDGTSATVSMEKDYMLTGAYGVNLLERFFVGANLKFITSTLGGKYNATAIAADLGFIYRSIDSKLSLGVVARNFGTQLTYLNVGDSLPQEIRLGFSYRFGEQFYDSSLLTVAVDTVSPIDQSGLSLFGKLNLGLEWKPFNELISLRAGYKIGYNPNSFSLGLGFNIENAVINYVFLPSAVDTIYQASIAFRFGGLSRQETLAKLEEKGLFERAQYVRSPDDYMYARADVSTDRTSFIPHITGADPGKAGPGAELRISGDKFGSEIRNVSVRFDGVAAEVYEVSGKNIRVRIPNVPAGTARIEVSTDKGISQGFSFAVLPLKPPMLSVERLAFSDDNDDQVLSADENGKITFTVVNKQGAGECFGLAADISCSCNGITYQSKLKIGDIPSGGEQRVEIPVFGSLDIPEGKAIFEMIFSEANDSAPDKAKLEISTKRLKPPDLQVAQVEIDDSTSNDAEKLSVGNGNGKIELGESVEFAVTLINKGTGVTKDGKVSIVADDTRLTLLSPSIIDLGDIKPSGWKQVKFTVRIEKQYAGDSKLPISLEYSDKRERFNKVIPVGVSLGAFYGRSGKTIAGKNDNSTDDSSGIPVGDDLVPIPKYATNGLANAYAVVVGIEKYRDIVRSDYAAQDARSFKDYLIKGMGFKEENIRLAVDERASRNDLTKCFDVWLKNNVEQDSTVIVYYSGHGAPDPATGETYLVPYDGDQNSIKQSGYSLKQLYSTLKELPTKKVLVVLDSCFSGAGGPRTIMAKGTRPIVSVEKADSGELVVMSATDSSQIAGGFQEKGHGTFTYYFLKGLQGDADLRKTGKIYLSDLYTYLRPQVSKYARRHNIEQEPQLLTGPAKLREWEKVPLVILK